MQKVHSTHLILRPHNLRLFDTEFLFLFQTNVVVVVVVMAVVLIVVVLIVVWW